AVLRTGGHGLWYFAAAVSTSSLGVGRCLPFGLAVVAVPTRHRDRCEHRESDQLQSHPCVCKHDLYRPLQHEVGSVGSAKVVSLTTEASPFPMKGDCSMDRDRSFRWPMTYIRA